MEKFKPILFSTQMVQALGTKNQTRRIIKEPIILKEGQFIDKCEGWNKKGDFAVKEKAPGYPDRWIIHQVLKNKYSKGDILWVRETWQTDYNESEEKWEYIYKSDGRLWIDDDGPLKWKPSIFMPKEAARNFLQVIKVRIERLNKITEEDAIGEGILKRPNAAGTGIAYFDYGGKPSGNSFNFSCPIESFKTLWESIHGVGSWKNNPWVWVYDFYRINKPTNFF